MANSRLYKIAHPRARRRLQIKIPSETILTTKAASLSNYEHAPWRLVRYIARLRNQENRYE